MHCKCVCFFFFSLENNYKKKKKQKCILNRRDSISMLFWSLHLFVYMNNLLSLSLGWERRPVTVQEKRRGRRKSHLTAQYSTNISFCGTVLLSQAHVLPAFAESSIDDGAALAIKVLYKTIVLFEVCLPYILHVYCHIKGLFLCRKLT